MTEQPPREQIQIAPGVTCAGAYRSLPDFPGYFWLSADAELTMQGALFAAARKVHLKLSISKLEHYPVRPVEIELRENQVLLATARFEAPDQTIVLDFEVAQRSEPVVLSITANSCFISTGPEPGSAPREMSVILHDFSVVPLRHAQAPAGREEGNVLPAAEPCLPTSAGAAELRIGIDARTLTYEESTVRGIGHYAASLSEALAVAAPHHTFFLYLDEPGSNEILSNLSKHTNVRLKTFADNPAGDRLDAYLILDPMSVPAGMDSPFVLAPDGVPLSIILYDFIPLIYRTMYLDTWLPAARTAYQRRLRQAKESDGLFLAISENTKKDLLSILGVSESRTAVVMAGLNGPQSPAPAPDEVEAVLRKYAIARPFFLFVGSHEPHKNFMAAVNAFLTLRRAAPAKLIVPGTLIDPYKVHNKRFLEEQKIEDVLFTGYIARRELECLYSAASALLFTSLYEGFGFPVLEAMAHSCPVIAAGNSSIPEVAGDAAVLIDPADTGRTADIMLQMLRNPGMRDALIERGRERAKLFTWALTARKVLEALEQKAQCRRRQPELQQSEKNPAAALPAASPQAAAAEPRPRLAWLSPVLNMSGYAMAARNIIKGLLGREYPVDLIPLCASTQCSLDTHTLKLIMSAVKYSPDQGSVLVAEALPANQEGEDLVEKTKRAYPGMSKYIFCTMFETDSIPRQWVAPCAGLEEVWVPTQFNVETFTAAGIKPQKLRRVPFLGFDPGIYMSTTYFMSFPGNRQFNFLSLFEWTKRKGWDVLLRAYVEEFSPDENVSLNLYVYRGLGTNRTLSATAMAHEYVRRVLGRRWEDIPLISIYEGMSLSDAMMPSVYRAAQAFVLPSRGEGWGMPYLEAMACGLPVIGTDWGGCREFMHRGNSLLLAVDGLTPVDQEQVQDNIFYSGHSWAEPSVRHLRELMRYLFSHQAEAAALGERARREVFEKWTIYHAADRVIDALSGGSGQAARGGIAESSLLKPAFGWRDA